MKGKIEGNVRSMTLSVENRLGIRMATFVKFSLLNLNENILWVKTQGRKFHQLNSSETVSSLKKLAAFWTVIKT
jgi:hypothetical protein